MRCPPLNVTLPPPSIVVSRVTVFSEVKVIVVGFGPQLKVMTPPCAIAAANAASVQLPGVPLPTTEVGLVVSTGRGRLSPVMEHDLPIGGVGTVVGVRVGTTVGVRTGVGDGCGVRVGAGVRVGVLTAIGVFDGVLVEAAVGVLDGALVGVTVGRGGAPFLKVKVFVPRASSFPDRSCAVAVTV